MELKPALKKLEESEEFKSWNKNNPDNFFSYAFKILEDGEKDGWQLGFYRKKTDKITTFIVDKSTIEMKKEEEIFKKPDMEVRKIDIEKLKISFEKILKKSKEFQKKEYSKELINKTIVILQNLEGYGTIWNITYVTRAFNTLNMKINTEDGKIIDHNLESLMSLIKK